METQAGVHKKGLATQPWRELQLALPNLRALRFSPSPNTGEQKKGKKRGKLSLNCALSTPPQTGSTDCSPPMDMIALNNFFPAGDP